MNLSKEYSTDSCNIETSLIIPLFVRSPVTGPIPIRIHCPQGIFRLI